MKILTVLALAFSLTGCAFYRISATTPDGLEVSGVALIANDSERVGLKIEKSDFKASFTKLGTAGEIQADALVDVVDTVTGPLP